YLACCGTVPQSSFFFTNPSPPTATYTLSLHDALPIFRALLRDGGRRNEPHQLRAVFGHRADDDVGTADVNPDDVAHRSPRWRAGDRKSTRLNSSHVAISYAVFCLKKKKEKSTSGTSRV